MGQIKVEKMSDRVDYMSSSRQYTAMTEDILWRHTTRTTCMRQGWIWYSFRTTSP